MAQFRSLRGQSALDAQKPTQEAIDDAFNQARSGLKSPYQQQEFDHAVRSYQQRYISGIMTSHADQEAKSYATSQNKASHDLATNGAATVANDPSAVDQFLHDGRAAAIRQVQLDGNENDPQIVKDAVLRSDQKIYASVAQAKSVHDPNGALEYIEQHRRELGDQYDNLAKATRARADQQFGTTKAAAKFADIQTGATQAPVAGVPANFISGIKTSEGFASKAAWDFKQNTNGYGTRAQSPNEVIDRATADQRFNAEIAKAAAFVDKFAPDLDPGTRAALTSLTFNAGTDWANSGLGAAIKAGDLETAKASFLQYNKAGGVENSGLVARRQREASWFGQNDIAPASAKATLYQQMMTDPELKDRPAALNAALNWVNHTITQQEFAASADQRARKQASDTTENTVLKDLYGEKPTTTVNSILENPHLERDAKQRLIGVMERVTKPDPLSRVSQDNTTSLLDRIRRPDGDPMKITNLDPLYDEFIAGGLKKEDFNFLRKELSDIRTPEGELLGRRKADFIKGVKPSIDKSNPLMGTLDQTGAQQMYMLEWDIDKRVDEYRKAGKNPHDLFNPSKPDYLGKPEALAPYQKDLQQSLADRVKQLAPKPVAPAAVAAPPMDGAKRAPDGNWYVEREGKFFKVNP